MTLTKFIAFLSILTIAFGATVAGEESEEINLDANDDEYPPCKKEDGTPGYCVPFTYCNQTTKTIQPGGNIISSELRDFHETCRRSGIINWCCDNPMEPPAIETTRAIDSCLLLDSDICTWCVTLHKVRNSSIMDVEAFCVGALIGSKLILTAATCLIAAQKHTLFAQVPASPDKTRKYVADQLKLHPEYNSGTHSSDFGIIVLKEEVDWGTMAASGACLNPVPIGGNCMTFGLDTADNFVSTFIEVTQGQCTNIGGSKYDQVFCGESIEAGCFAVPGAPVVCDNGSNGLALVGVTRSRCIDRNITLGSYEHSKPFIITELKSMKVDPIVYTA